MLIINYIFLIFFLINYILYLKFLLIRQRICKRDNIFSKEHIIAKIETKSNNLLFILKNRISNDH